MNELEELEKMVEENQFVAHANSILETEHIVEKARTSGTSLRNKYNVPILCSVQGFSGNFKTEGF